MFITPKTRPLWCILHHPKYVSYHIIYMMIVVTGRNSLGMKPQCLCKRRRGVTCIAYKRRMMPNVEGKTDHSEETVISDCDKEK